MLSTFREVVLPQAFTLNPGDEVKLAGGMLQVWNGNTIISTFPVTLGPQTSIGPAAESRTIHTLFLVEEVKMPGVTSAITGAERNPNGSIVVHFSSNNREFGSFEELMSTVASLDTTTELAEDILLMKLVQRSPDGSNLENMNGGSCTVNRDAAEPVTVNYPE